MSNRTAQANKAVADAWQKEQQLVSKGKGTRDWTPQQQHDILNKGKAYDDNGKAFQGHHMKSAERYPEFQGDCNNIQFLTRKEHFDAHGGNFQNSTNGYFNCNTGETMTFSSHEYEPCNVINLSEPMAMSLDGHNNTSDITTSSTDKSEIETRSKDSSTQKCDYAKKAQQFREPKKGGSKGYESKNHSKSNTMKR